MRRRGEEEEDHAHQQRCGARRREVDRLGLWAGPARGLARPVDRLKYMYLVVFVLDYCVAYYFDISMIFRGI